ncbi:uncharacterized protein G2W53_016668 [Senna tora]|uniref:Uncharacterized protein n=1 Tax=Senna tora TaxID=362788 RepID=A0A834TPU6_9FABA|nr:uncharacterized protein G2W53_016668 [Senna tora]
MERKRKKAENKENEGDVANRMLRWRRGNGNGRFNSHSCCL